MTIQDGQNKIEEQNSLWGKQTILVNGEKVSEAHSFSVREHKFTLKDDGRDVLCSVWIMSSFYQPGLDCPDLSAPKDCKI